MPPHDPKQAAKERERSVLMPSEIDDRIGFFDRFAGWASQLASRAPFFSFCLFLVVAWMAEGAVRALRGGGFEALLDDKYQLQINTTTTIITFLMVALLQNSATRGDQAIQHKLNAIADALADLMDRTAERYDDGELRCDIEELRAAVGLEERETTTRR